MNEQGPSAGDPSTAPAAPAVSGSISAGAYLRAAREAAGLQIGALAVSLKVPVKKLEALEGDRIDELPDAVFARALAASVCRTLKLDPAQVLALLPGHSKPNLQIQARVSNASFQARPMHWNQSLWSRVPKAVLAGAALLVLAAAALLVYPTLREEFAGTGAVETAGMPTGTDPASPQGTIATSTGSGAGVVVQPGPGTVAVPAAGTADTAGVGTAPLAPALSAAPANVSALPASTPAVPVAAPGSEALSFKARGSASWVQVTDANGVSQLRKTLTEGEIASVGGALPLSVVVGRADATEVLVRGKPMDLSSVTRDNVARFQVK